MSFDPDSAALGDGLFGLPEAEDALFVVLPVPFDATTSYRDGTRKGPAAVLAASAQIDLYDLDYGRPWQRGIAMRPLEEGFAAEIAALNQRARALAEPIIARGGQIEGEPGLEEGLAEVNRLSARMCELVEAEARALLEEGRVPIVLGGDHSCPLGAIRAYAAAAKAAGSGLGILHLDAHADLRVAYEGFTYSHASIMHHVAHGIGRAGGVERLVQVGIRDFGERELEAIRRPRGEDEAEIRCFFDAEIHARRHEGEAFGAIAASIVEALPAEVYVSVDIDGLDPTLCPDTGTPVPGGLGWNEALTLLRALVKSGRRIVGFDLVEVAPSAALPAERWGEDWNANVGARLLYKLIGATAASRERSPA